MERHEWVRFRRTVIELFGLPLGWLLYKLMTPVFRIGQPGGYYGEAEARLFGWICRKAAWVQAAALITAGLARWKPFY